MHVLHLSSFHTIFHVGMFALKLSCHETRLWGKVYNKLQQGRLLQDKNTKCNKGASKGRMVQTAA